MSGENEEMHTCFTCEKSFITRNDLVSHLKSHSMENDPSGSGNYSSSCENNKNVPLSRLDVRKKTNSDFSSRFGGHNMQSHSSSKTRTDFNQLPKEVPSLSIQDDDGKYVCMVCEKTFKYLSKLKVHSQKHVNAKNVTCDICYKTFSDQYILRDHMIAHSGIKPYACDICGQGFAWKPCVIVHRRKHTGEKPYKCSFCKWAFPTNTHLKRHVAEIHSDERPFQCNVCDKTFSIKSRLKEHMKNHGDSPTLKALLKLGYTLPELTS